MAAEARECRICLESHGELISPCLCRGSQLCVHLACLEQWHVTEIHQDLKCMSCRSAYEGHAAIHLARAMWESIKKRTADEVDMNRLAVANQLACTLSDGGEHEEATAIYRHLCEVMAEAHGHDHPNTLVASSNLASHLGRLGKLQDAVPLLRITLEEQRRLRGTDHLEPMATANALAVCLAASGAMDEAAAMHLENVAIAERVLGPDHPETLVTAYNVALMHRMRGEFSEAAPKLRDVLERRTRVLGPEHPLTKETAAILGGLWRERCALYFGMALPPSALIFGVYTIVRFIARWRAAARGNL